jgi:hypothetical protein
MSFVCTNTYTTPMYMNLHFKVATKQEGELFSRHRHANVHLTLTELTFFYRLLIDQF